MKNVSDIKNLIVNLGISIGYRITPEKVMKYAIDKNLSIKNIVIKRTPKIANEKRNLSKFSDNEFSNKINEFACKIDKELPNVNKNFFNHNTKSLKIEKTAFLSDEIEDLVKTIGTYNPETNTITLIDKDSIFYELLHLSSTINTKRTIFTGFAQMKKGINSFEIGRCLNDGYTEILEKRYFNKPVENKFQFSIVNRIERLVGKDIMEKLYFEGDLYGLIEEIKKYNCSEEEILRFLRNCDFTSAILYLPKSDFSNKVFLDCINEIKLFLRESYNYKLQMINKQKKYC